MRCVAVVALALAMGGVQPPDLNGSWKLDEKRSLWPGSAPDTHVLTIKQTKDEVVLMSTAEGWKKPMVYSLGAETVEEGKNFQVTTRARWEGAALVVQTTRVVHQTDGSDFTTVSTDSFRLASANELTVDRVMKTPRGEQGFKLVYTRQ